MESWFTVFTGRRVLSVPARASPQACFQNTPRPRKKKRAPKGEQESYDAELLRTVLANESAWVCDLLELGADPNTCDERGEPLLWHVLLDTCAGFGLRDTDKVIIRALLAAGADPELHDVVKRMRAARRARAAVGPGGQA